MVNRLMISEVFDSTPNYHLQNLTVEKRTVHQINFTLILEDTTKCCVKFGAI